MDRILSIVLIGPLLLLPNCGDHASPASPASPVAMAAPALQAEPLRDAARDSGKLVGTAVQSALLADGRYAGVAGRHFNYLTAEYEMKWDPIERVRGNNDFAAGDAIVSYARAN